MTPPVTVAAASVDPRGSFYTRTRGRSTPPLPSAYAAKAGVRPSMGSVGDAYDNALCESFSATLECELIEQERFQNQAEARMAIFDFIEGWYNPHRRHSALGQMSPLTYEKQHAQAA